MRLFSIKIGWEDFKSKDNDSSAEENSSCEAVKPNTAELNIRLKFEYITEVAPKISNFQADKMKPSYLNVIVAKPVRSEKPVYYVYLGIGKHAAVYKRTTEQISPPMLVDFN